jgi:hypothetical protein
MTTKKSPQFSNTTREIARDLFRIFRSAFFAIAHSKRLTSIRRRLEPAPASQTIL